MPRSQTTSRISLPDDVETLRQMIHHLLTDMHDKDREILDLRCQLEALKRRVFGRRSETVDPNQLALFEDLTARLEAAEAENPAEQATDERPKAKRNGKKNGHGRKPLPADLPRERIEIPPKDEDRICPCCNKAMSVIGEEVTEELDYVPASFVVRALVRPKYACKACQEGVVIADLPPRPIEKGRPGSGLLAHVLTSKYGDHLPLHRLEGIFRRHGIDIARSTMCDWVGAMAFHLAPIVRQMRREVLTSKMVHTDDTSVPVQDRSRTTTRKASLWVYLGDNATAVYDYTTGRSRAGPVTFFGDYAGYIQADAYAGYDELFKPSADDKPRPIEVGCWAHARRKFYDARLDDRRRCNEMLALIGRLYDVERDAKEKEPDADARCGLRRQRSVPVLDQIRSRLEAWSVETLPRGPVGKAVAYARGQWEALTRYVTDGDLAIDNNPAERALRTVVIGRKNWLFAGSDAGGRRAAIMYSLIASCKLCEIDPFAYLRDVIDRVSTHPARRIAELTPAGWKAAKQPAADA